MGILAFISCIQNENLNAEADITACKVSEGTLIREPVITNEKITLSIDADITWGINDIFKKSFKTITFNMYPIYLNIGFGYRF